MSSKTRQATETEAKPAYENNESRNASKRPCVYCGPSVRGVARQYTVYAASIPAALEEFVKNHPAAKGLLVPVERFAETRRRLETAGTAEAILYNKIKSEL